MAKYKGKEVELNKPFRTPNESKKFAVYVKNDKGNIVKVRFGDSNMEIKRDDPERRKAFRKRHKCDQKKDKTTPGYWSCQMWSNKPVSDILEKKEDTNMLTILKNEALLIKANRMLKEEPDIEKMIKDLQGDFGSDNESQMRGVQLLKGLATSDDEKANKFMQALDKATTKISKDIVGD